MLYFQWPEQSGSEPGKSTTNRILALRVLLERRIELRQWLFAAYIYLKKAFDSVYREELWDIMQIRGIFGKIIDF